MELFTERRQEFIAKTFSDMGKAIFTVGIATFFFKGLPHMYRIGCMIASIDYRKYLHTS